MANTVEIILKGTDLTGPAFTGSIRRMRDVGSAASSMFAVFATGAAVGAVGSLAALAARSIQAADEMGKLAQKAGLPVEQFSQLAHSAKLADVSTQSLQTGIKKLSEEMVKQGRGSESVLSQMLAQADVFKRMEDGAEKTALAVQLFGKSGQDLIPLLNQGSAAIREQMQEADRLGLTISADFAAQADEFGDNLDKMKASLVGVGNELTKSILPELKKFSDWALESQAIPIFIDTIATSISDLSVNVKTLIDSLKALPQHISNAGKGAPQWLQPGMKPGALDAEFDAFKSGAMGSDGFIGPPVAPARSTRSGSGRGVGSIPTPLTPGATDMFVEWETKHAEAMLRAQELERQFRAEQVGAADTKAELEAQQYDQSMARIDNEYQTRLANIARLRIDEDTAINLSNLAWESHHAKLNQLDAQTAAQRRANMLATVQVAAQTLSMGANLAATFGRKGFALAQTLRYGEAVMSTASGVARALAEFPYPYSIVIGALVAAQGAIQMATISRQKPPAAHGGLDFVPAEQTFLLARGERVLSPKQNRDLTEAMDEGRVGGGQMLHVQFIMDGKPLYDGIEKASRDGRLRIHARAVA